MLGNSRDRDFPQIFAITAATSPSVVLIRQQRLRAELAEPIVSIWREHDNALEQGCVLRASARGTQVRRSPLR